MAHSYTGILVRFLIEQINSLVLYLVFNNKHIYHLMNVGIVLENFSDYSLIESVD